MTFVVKGRTEEPSTQTHEDIFISPLGVTVVGVTSTFKDGGTEYAIYIEDTENPEEFDVVGVYDMSPAGEHDSMSATFIATRTLEIVADILNKARLS